MSPAFVWLAVAASIVMGLGGACLFVFAVKKGYFQDFENAKYQVFWPDLEELVDGPAGQESHERRDKSE